MLIENDRKKTSSKVVTSIQHLNDIEKSTRETHQYFVEFESQIHVQISTSNQCHTFHVDFPFKINEILTNFHVEVRRGIDGASTEMCPFG